MPTKLTAASTKSNSLHVPTEVWNNSLTKCSKLTQKCVTNTQCENLRTMRAFPELLDEAIEAGFCILGAISAMVGTGPFSESCLWDCKTSLKSV